MAAQKSHQLDLENCDWDDGPLIEAYDKAKAKAAAKILKQSKKQAAKTKESVEKEWRVGSYCRALYPEDGYYYEAKIVHLLSDEGTCVVSFLGYEDQVEVLVDALRLSKGKRARKAQVKGAVEASVMSLTCEEASDAASGSDESSVLEGSCQGNRAANNAAAVECTTRETSVKAPRHIPIFVPPKPAQLANKMTHCYPIPPPPAAAMPPHCPPSFTNDPSMAAMLRSWYMAGYYTGLYENQMRGSCCQAQCCCPPMQYGHH